MVRRLYAQGTVSSRGKEDPAIRAGRTTSVAVGRLDHLPYRRRHRHHRDVEGVRQTRRTRLVSSPNRPRMVSVQAAGCAPIVRAFMTGATTAEPWTDARTVADGLRVPSALDDFLVVRALRDSAGTAVAVSDPDMITGMRDLGRFEGISAGPEGVATLGARGDRPRRPRGAVQYRRGVEVSRAAGPTVSQILSRPSSVDCLR